MVSTDVGGYEFDVAVSFAGEDRVYVESIVQRLKSANVRVFYDQDYQIETWGEDLVEYFDAVYRIKSRFAVLFISKPYAEKMWTRHERRSALARGLYQADPYVLPVRLDDTQLEGLRPTVGYLDARQVGADGVVRATLAKLGEGESAHGTKITRVPRTELERQQLLLDRSPGWEFVYFAGQLLHERTSVEEKYLDHEVRFAPRSGISVSSDTTLQYLGEAAREAGALVTSLMRLMEPAVQERAFGATGEPGDADRILHLAKRWNSIYVGWMDWAARLRAVNPPPDCEQATELLARFVDRPIDRYRAFVDELIKDTDRALASQVDGATTVLRLELIVDIPDEVTRAFSNELERLKRTQS